MSARRRGPLTAVLLVLSVALSGCGLPSSGGVRSAGRVAAQDAGGGPVQVLPPGPRPGADAREVVVGFLRAQTSPDGAHAVARQFLAPELARSWDDSSNVVVYDPGSLDVVPDADDSALVHVTAATVADIAPSGAYSLASGTLQDTYTVARTASGELRLVDVPAGLRLTQPGLAGSFTARSVYFLAPGAGAPPNGQLVPDRVFLPATAPPDELVRRLVDGPTAALAGAVTNAVPPTAKLRAPVRSTDGVLTVDLTGLGRAGADQRRQLSAQLVWTLLDGVAGATKVRLLVDGRPLAVPDAGQLEDRSDWAGFDPSGPVARGTSFYIADRRVARVDGTPQRGDLGDGRVPVDVVASSPTDGRLAVVTHAPGGDVVRTGAASGASSVVVLQRPHVTSMSFGSGDRGLWVVATGATGPEVLLVPGDPAVPPFAVPFAAPTGAGDLSTLRVSRDGTRVAAVFGSGTGRRLYVGQVEVVGTGVQIAGLQPVAPLLPDVADVAWASGTTVVALAPLGTPNRLPVQVAVDGSVVEPVRTLGLDGEPQTVAAAPDRPLLIGTQVAGRPVLLVEDNGLFRLHDGAGSAPAYPG